MSGLLATFPVRFTMKKSVRRVAAASVVVLVLFLVLTRRSANQQLEGYRTEGPESRLIVENKQRELTDGELHLSERKQREVTGEEQHGSVQGKQREVTCQEQRVAGPLKRREARDRTPDLPVNMSVTSLGVAALRVLERRPMLVTFINDGYVSMTNNWLCHTRHLEGLHQNMLIIAQDESTKARLNRMWPKVLVNAIHQGNVTLKGRQTFNSVGYVRMMVRRTELLNELLRSGISFVLFETDFVWFENPVPDFVELAFKDSLDLVGTKSAAPEQIMCGGFIYFRNTYRTRAVWAEVLRLMHVLDARMNALDNKDKSPKYENEQRYLNTLLKEHFGGVRYGLVDYNRTVADGQWYRKSKEARFSPLPKVIHNNFLVNVPLKVKRFQKFQQWFVRRNGSCDEQSIAQLLTLNKSS